jgi:hypothetical protein
MPVIMNVAIGFFVSTSITVGEKETAAIMSGEVVAQCDCLDIRACFMRRLKDSISVRSGDG